MLTPRRRHDPELMDAPGLPADEVADAYRVLRRVNRQVFGGLRPIRRELSRLLREASPLPRSLSLLDVGAGSGDLADDARRFLAGRGLAPLTFILDHDPTAARLARDGGLAVIRGDALRLPFADRSVDVVLAVKFAHHFGGDALAALLAELARVARRRVVVLDIRRDWRAYWGFVAWSRAFTRNRFVRHDGPLSVLRGFTVDELADLAADVPGLDWSVRPYLGFQLALVGRRD